MARLIGKNKLNCAVFISGRGSNLKSIYNYSKKKKSKIKLNFFISKKSNIEGIRFAKKNRIRTKIIKYKNKIEAEKTILFYLKENNIKFVCLAGYMKILSKYFFRHFKYKIINIHPSLLPKYKGINTHKRAIQNKDKYSGYTVHFVNQKLDSGKPVMKKKVKIFNSDTPKSLAKRILKAENRIYPMAIDKILSKN